MPPLKVQDKISQYTHQESAHMDVTYAGIVIVGVTEVNVGSFVKVKSTPVPVKVALSMCTVTEPVEGRDEVFPG